MKGNIWKLKGIAICAGYLQDQDRVLTNTGQWLRDWSSESWNFIPIGPSSLIQPATTTMNVATGFVANNSTFKALTTSQAALYICERIGKYNTNELFRESALNKRSLSCYLIYFRKILPAWIHIHLGGMSHSWASSGWNLAWWKVQKWHLLIGISSQH